MTLIKNQSVVHLTGVVAAIFAAYTVAPYASAQSDSSFSVYDSRPLAAVSDILEQVIGVPVNYEDTLYRNVADSEDIQAEKYGFVEKGYQLLIPRRGMVSGTLVATRASSDADKLTNIEALLNSYRNAKLPGEFKVEQANGMFYVVPSKTLSSGGAVLTISPLMTQMVSFPQQQRTATDAIQLVLRLAGQPSHANVALSTLLFSPTQMVEVGASGQPARDVLQTIVKACTNAQVTYRLLSIPDPKGGPDYLMSMQYTGSAPWASAAQVTGYMANERPSEARGKPPVMTQKDGTAPATSNPGQFFRPAAPRHQ